MFDSLTPLDVILVATSIVTAILVAQLLVSAFDRAAHTEGGVYAGWIMIGSLCIGAGVWIMNFSAALALFGAERRPFRLALAVLGIALAILGTALGLLIPTNRRPGWARLVVGGVVAGACFATSYFVGVRSLGGSMTIDRQGPLVAAMAAISILNWTILLWISARVAFHPVHRSWVWRVLAAATVVAALAALSVGTLWTFDSLSAPVAADRLLVHVTPEGLLAITGAVWLAIAAALLAAIIDRRIRKRRAETVALRRSEDRFRSLVQASSQIVWTTAADGQMLGDQSSWAEFTGQSEGSYRGWGWFNAIHPEDRERTARYWEETLANGRPLELEHRIRRHDGHYRDCIVRLVPVMEANGSVREWVGTHTDITDRSRMQQERDLLAEAGRVLSSSLDDDETLAAVARLLVPRVAEWCAIDVISEDESLRRIVGIHRDPNRSSLVRENGTHLGSRVDLRSVLENGESKLLVERPGEVPEPPGPTRASRSVSELGGKSLICVPLLARGQVLGTMTLAAPDDEGPFDLRDLSVAEELARRAAIAVDNARLYASSQSAIRARDEVLGVVSHDLRNPLGTISTASQLMLDVDLSPPERRKHLEIVWRSAKAANRLIQDLLDVSQSESNQLVMDFHSTDPTAVATEACELMRHLAEGKGQRLTCKLPERLPPLRADPARLQQVLSNLIGNAIKFTPDSGNITVGVMEIAEGIEFFVADTGPGITPEELPRLFDRHWRASKTAHLGAGLGLSISKGIVEAHDGRIWAESEPGRGTTFRFLLPKTSSVPEAAEGGDQSSSSLVTTAPE